MCGGLTVGVALGPAVEIVKPDIGVLIGNWLAVPGQLHLAAIQMIVVPLVVASRRRALLSVLGLDRVLDMSRTSINVAGDLAASQVMDRCVGAPPGQIVTDAGDCA